MFQTLLTLWAVDLKTIWKSSDHQSQVGADSIVGPDIFNVLAVSAYHAQIGDPGSVREYSGKEVLLVMEGNLRPSEAFEASGQNNIVKFHLLAISKHNPFFSERFDWINVQVHNIDVVLIEHFIVVVV